MPRSPIPWCAAIPKPARRLFVNPVYVSRFEDMTEVESRPLLDTLQAQATRAEMTAD